MTADLDPILRRLADHERIEALAITLREQAAARLHVAPALTAARPAIVAALATLTQRPLLYVVGSGEAALRAREDLCQWLDPDTVLLFPAGDALPYEPMSPGNDVIAGRLRVLRSAGRWEIERLGDREGVDANPQSPISHLPGHRCANQGPAPAHAFASRARRGQHPAEARRRAQSRRAGGALGGDGLPDRADGRGAGRAEPARRDRGYLPARR